MASLKTVAAITDTEERAKAAARLLKRREQAAEAELTAIREVRDDAVRTMLEVEKRRPADAARAIGVTRSAITNRFGASGR